MGECAAPGDGFGVAAVGGGWEWSCGPYPRWDVAALYRQGDRVVFRDRCYEARLVSVGTAPVSDRRGPRTHVWRRL